MKWFLTLTFLLSPQISMATAVDEIQFSAQALASELLFPNRNIRLYYHGHKTKCAVVVTHGLYQSPRDMIGLSQDLFDAGCNVVAPLLPGHWRKDKTAFYKINESHWILVHQQAMAWASELGDQVSVLGHSTGALLSFKAALIYPEKIHRLVMLAPALKLTTKTTLLTAIGTAINSNRITKDAKSEYEQAAKSAVAGNYVQKLIDQTFITGREQTYKSLSVPFLVASTENDDTISHSEVIELLKHAQVENQSIIYSKSQSIQHDNIQRNRKDLNPADPKAWENKYYQNLSQKIQNFILN